MVEEAKDASSGFIAKWSRKTAQFAVNLSVNSERYRLGPAFDVEVSKQPLQPVQIPSIGDKMRLRGYTNESMAN